MLSRARFSTLAPRLVKVSVKDAPSGFLSSLAVVVPKAGARNGPLGYGHLLSKFAFLNNAHKSALRFTRESELLGGVVSAKVERDALILSASFLKQDLPYYVDALANVCSNTAFRPHELVETVLPSAKAQYKAAHSSNAFSALEEAHAISFSHGLGKQLYYDGVAPASIEEIAAFAKAAFNDSSLHIVASGVNESDLSSFLSDSSFSTLGQGSSSTPAVKSYTGNHSRISAGGQNSAIIAVPVTPKDFESYERLAVAAGSSIVPCPNSPLTQIPGAAAHLYKYAEAGLFVVQISGDAHAVASGIKLAKRAVDAAASGSLDKYAKNAALLAALQTSYTAAASSPSSAKPTIAKFNYVAIGNLDVLPYADEL